MQAKLKLTPGQKGTKKLLKVYGDKLVCVRYRYNSELKKKFKTVEIIIEESPWIPKNKSVKKGVIKVDKPVSIHVAYKETALRDKVKEAGGRWKQDEKVWVLNYRKAVELGLESRIVR